MAEWVEHVLVPFIRSQIELLSLEEDQKAILLLDTYPVHTGEEFRTLMHEKYPNIFLTFIPANCTPILQPADFGLQRVFKHKLKLSALDWMVATHTEQLKTGLSAEQVMFLLSSSMIHLSNPSSIFMTSHRLPQEKN
jgi:hypothetical protein